MSEKLCTVSLLHELLSGRNAARENSTAEDSRLCPGPPPPGSSLRRGSSLSPLFPDQPRAYALSGVPCPRSVYFHRRGRGRMHGGYWDAPQTRRHALDQTRLQRHHCSPLLKTQWSVSRLLGAQIRTQGRVTHHFLGVRPGES